MNNLIFEKIINALIKKNVRFGETNITFTWHDGKVVKYKLTTSESYNVNSKDNKGENYVG